MSNYVSLSKEVTYDLIDRAKGGDEASAEKLIEVNMGLVKSLAVKFSGMGYETEDLIQIGCIGLLKAIERFDCERGLMLSTYAVPMILGEIKRYIRDDGKIKMSRQLKQEIREMRKLQESFYNKNGTYPRLSILAELMGTEKEHILELLEAQDALFSTASLDDPENLIIRPGSVSEAYCDEDKNIDLIYLKEILGELSEKERKIIVLRYFKDLTQQQTAAKIGISQVQVSRIEKRVLTQLRSRMAE